MSNKTIENKNKEIFTYISFLTVISAIAVIILHGSIYRFDGANPSNYWFISNFIMCFFFFAVPIFYMISGATLINYSERYDTKVYFLKRAKKVLIPFIFWLIFFALFRIYFMHIPVNENILLFIYNDGINGNLYWFFIPLFAIYLVIPLLNSIPKNKRIGLFTFYSVLIFIFFSILPALINVFTIPIVIRQEFFFISGFFIYPLLGYILNEIDLSKKYRIIFYVLGILGFLGMFVPTQLFYDATGQSTYLFKSYTYPTTVLYSIAVWIFIKEICKYDFTKKFNKIVDFIKPYTFGLYLIHYYLFISITYYLKLNNQSFLYSIASPIIVFALSMIILIILKKIPYVRNIVP